MSRGGGLEDLLISADWVAARKAIGLLWESHPEVLEELLGDHARIALLPESALAPCPAVWDHGWVSYRFAGELPDEPPPDHDHRWRWVGAQPSWGWATSRKRADSHRHPRTRSPAWRRSRRAWPDDRRSGGSNPGVGFPVWSQYVLCRSTSLVAVRTDAVAENPVGVSSARAPTQTRGARSVRARLPPCERGRREAAGRGGALRPNPANGLRDDGLRALGRRRPRRPHPTAGADDRLAPGGDQDRPCHHRSRLHPRGARGRRRRRSRRARLHRARSCRVRFAHPLGPGRVLEFRCGQFRGADRGDSDGLLRLHRPAAIRLPGRSRGAVDRPRRR